MRKKVAQKGGIVFIVFYWLPMVLLGQPELATINGPEQKGEQAVLFTENKGQVADQYSQPRRDVLYYGQVNGLIYHLRDNGISYQQTLIDSWKSTDPEMEGPDSLPDETTIYRTDINWIGINEDYVLETGDARAGYENFYLPVCPNGVHDVASYHSVTYKNLYDGIDLKWYNNNGQLEYDFIVAPGANCNQIVWEINGANSLQINEVGELVIETALGQIIEQAPIAYQEGEQVEVQWLIDNNQVSFQVDKFDHAKSLRIDPIVRSWCTYYGGNELDYIIRADLDEQNQIYSCGFTVSKSNIATVGSHQNSFKGDSDAFLVKFDDNGTRQWATYFGGIDEEWAQSCAVDNKFNVAICGMVYTNSTNLATPGGQQTKHGGGLNDAFLAKFDGRGVRLWSTYCGGKYKDYGRCCKVDDSLNVYLAGTSISLTGIATSNGFQSTASSGVIPFLVKYNANGKRLWGTYYGAENGRSYDCVVDDSLNVYLCGTTVADSLISTSGAHQEARGGQEDLFLVKFNSQGSRLWGTYFGDGERELLPYMGIDSRVKCIYRSRSTPLKIAGHGRSSSNRAMGVQSNHR